MIIGCDPKKIKIKVFITHGVLSCVKESVSDSRYGHDSISCMTCDIHVDILLECGCV